MTITYREDDPAWSWKKQDIAEVKREIRGGGGHPLLQDFFVKKIGILYAYDF